MQNDSEFDKWGGYADKSTKKAPAPVLDKANPIVQEDLEADQLFAKIEEYIDGKKIRKREQKAV